MSKRLKNYPDPDSIVDQYGADSLRLYLMSSTVMKGENLNFSEREVSDLRRKVFLIWWNMLSFYQLFGNKAQDLLSVPQQPRHVLDRWLVSELSDLTIKVTHYMNSYDVVKASRALIEFVNQFSTWYLRLSRDRVKAEDNQEVSQVFGWGLYRLAQLFAPFCPYFSELVHHQLIDESTSIHLTDWPKQQPALIDSQLQEQMELVTKVVELGRRVRAEQGIKLRHPLSKVVIELTQETKLMPELDELILEELNVKKLEWQVRSEAELTVSYDLSMTPELRAEAQARDLIREIQDLRKKARLAVDEQATVQLPDWPSDWQEEIQQRTNTKLVKGDKMRLIDDN